MVMTFDAFVVNLGFSTTEVAEIVVVALFVLLGRNIGVNVMVLLRCIAGVFRYDGS